jgi:hypothetical protein
MVNVGYENVFAAGKIYSRRKLSQKEVDSLIDYYSTNPPKEHLLVRDKTCYILWQI